MESNINIHATDETQSLLDEAEVVEANVLSSAEWVASINYFDVIRASKSRAVLDAVAAVRAMNLSPAELAGFLRGRAGERA